MDASEHKKWKGEGGDERKRLSGDQRWWREPSMTDGCCPPTRVQNQGGLRGEVRGARKGPPSATKLGWRGEGKPRGTGSSLKEKRFRLAAQLKREKV